MGLKDLELFVFNVYDIDNQKYLDYIDFKQITEKLELETVPLLSDNMLFVGMGVEDFLEMSKGNYKETKHPREGIVIRSLIEKDSIALEGRLSFKAVNPDYKDD